MSVVFQTFFPGGSDSKESACRTPGKGIKKIPWRSEWLPTPVFLPGEFHGQRNGRGAWRATVYGVAKSQTQLTFFFFSHAVPSSQFCYEVIFNILYLYPLPKVLWFIDDFKK